ncbi:MAG: S41 family peptidase [Lewinella sp.]|nr:S41 family peptidase [Lewinella sp.]
MRRRWRILLALVSTFVIAGAFTWHTAGDKYFEIIKNIEIFTNLYKEVNTYYVEEIDPGELMRTGLDAMVGSLDPFTNYISESDIEGYRFMSEGRYHGIGAQFALIDGYVTITELYRNQPADQAGLRPGDQIIAVDGNDASGRTEEEVNEIMQGYPGTSMDLLIRRPGETKDLHISLIRGEVNVPNVPYSGMVRNGIGYINLTTFSRDAGRNIQEALRALKRENPDLQGVILDLRNNGGGLLNEAVNICNLFIPRGEVVVTTRGKVEEWNRTYSTMNQAMDTEIPLAILINSHSASASEIVSGVMQDYDRGVLIGQRSYGKGLVQNTMDIGYNARVKITTAKYYIPSERCIQSVEYENGEPVHIPDERRARFTTRNGRTVLDGGGVKPDVVLDPITDEGIMKALVDEHVIFKFVTQWTQSHPTIDSVEMFHFNDFAGFERYLDESGFTYTSEAEKELQQLQEQLTKEGLSLSSELENLQKRIDTAQATELAGHREAIIDLIEKEIAGRYYYQRGMVQMGLRNDAEIDEAVSILTDAARYNSILGKQ